MNSLYYLYLELKLSINRFVDHQKNYFENFFLNQAKIQLFLVLLDGKLNIYGYWSVFPTNQAIL